MGVGEAGGEGASGWGVGSADGGGVVGCREYRCTRPDGRGPEDVSDYNEHLIDAETAPGALRNADG